MLRSWFNSPRGDNGYQLDRCQQIPASQLEKMYMNADVKEENLKKNDLKIQLFYKSLKLVGEKALEVNKAVFSG